MKALRGFVAILLVMGLVFPCSICKAQGQDYSGNEDPNKKILKQGLLGAGTGAIAAGASGGNAGKGALIGAGTNVIGGALLDTLTTPSQPQQVQQVQYVQAQPQYVQTQSVPSSYPVQQQAVYHSEPQPVYVQQAPVYYQQPPPQESSTNKILKQGLLGAGTGAIAAGASGGNAGKGALIGAGTNVIGGALLDALTGPSQPAPQPQPVYVQSYAQAPAPNYPTTTTQPKKKIIRHYDADGNITSEEEVWE